MTAALRRAVEVSRALAAGAPVVALESTVVTHGLPHPEGVAAALAMEAEIRLAGAVPATIGILAGSIVVGMSHSELDALVGRPDVAKVNPSNLAVVVASGHSGSTTVAATMLLAHANGISVMATGGIGGVHRGASETGDVSADLLTLARTPVAVVCAGAKAVLDLPRTREMLETHGIPVLGFQTDEFPAFYRRSSGLRVDHRCDGISDLAAAVRLHFELHLGSGLLVGNPIPVAEELPEDLYERALHAALTDVEAHKVKGRNVTPFLLERMRNYTDGDSVRANLALLRHNARVAAQLACALARST
ncbi:MAG: pseudouridine-5'-phosphate glycosidase [Acidobacteriota bacterium]